MTPEQHRRATALLPNLLDQVHAALQLAGWSLDNRTRGRDIELWRRPGAQPSGAPEPREQDQAAPAIPAKQKKQGKTATSEQAAPVASKILYVPAREGEKKIKDYRRTITASEITYTCKRCQNETTKLLFPGAIPLYCDTCAVEVKREKTRARVQRLRAGKKGGQVQAS
jgi:hypothetical protein